jgi:histidyl-tRNA synthetase
MKKPSVPQGTRDFGPDVVRKRNFILNSIKNVFELYGFQPLETPAMENLDTLMGKYGEEGNKLIFKILNNGLDHSSKKEHARAAFEQILEGKNSEDITERALKYDLTIPFARFVAMNHQQLNFPFKRYQIQPVWRADRPAKGRYREFYQCDADIVGSNSLLNEAELANIYHDVFTSLGLAGYRLKINHRGILLALAEIAGAGEKMMDITTAIDKLDKIGIEKVKKELSDRGLNESQVMIVEAYLSVSGDNDVKQKKIGELLAANKNGGKALSDLHELFSNYEIKATLDFDPSLARGLTYYTGVIFEAVAPPEVKIGSIGGGGRYDDLTGLFGVPGIPGVGISLGVDRIYDVLEELSLFPANIDVSTEVLFFNLGKEESRKAYSLMQQLRKQSVRCELFDQELKFDKQFRYAEKKRIPFVVIIGEEELKNNTCNIKNLDTGQQQTVPMDALLQYNFKKSS